MFYYTVHMCTVYNNNKQNKIIQLARLGETIFHTQDLGNLWHIYNKNTLYTLLKRYSKRKLLYRIYKGLYAINPVDKLDPMKLGLKAIHNYAYISTETVLSQYGIIQQKIQYITIISSISKKFQIANNNYYSRQLADKYLFNHIGIKNKTGKKIASVKRAVADHIYFNKMLK